MLLEPFHRMFSLDNLAIQFPHAEVERVPVSERSKLLHQKYTGGELADSGTIRLALWIRWRYSAPYSNFMGDYRSTRRPQGARDHTGSLHQPYPYIISD